MQIDELRKHTLKTPLYLLQGTIFRNQDNLTDLIEINEVFQDDSLIEARKRAFSKYQSYIDVFLESLGLVYESHEQTKRRLNHFFDSKRMQFPLRNPELGKVVVDFDKGLFIYLVTDSSDIFTTLEGRQIYNAKHLVHFIYGKTESLNELVLKELKLEFEFYESNGFSIKDHKCIICISGLFEDKAIPILKTPFEF